VCCCYNTLGKVGFRPPLHPPFSAVEQIDEKGAVLWPGQVLVQDEPEPPAKIWIAPGMGEDDGAGDDLAAGVALAITEGLAGLVELTAGRELVIGR
jgi:hypothetical protein